jgi:hypothetical protein
MLHNQEVSLPGPNPFFPPPRTGLTEVPLADSGDADPAELAYLPGQCKALTPKGSGAAVCNCGPGETAVIPTATATPMCIPLGGLCTVPNEPCCAGSCVLQFGNFPKCSTTP